MSDAWYRWDGGRLTLELRVQPRASRDQVVGPQAGRLKVRVTAPPVGGDANARLVAMLAKAFRVAKRDVSVVAGAQARDKRVVIRDPRDRPGWLPAG